MKNIKSVLLIVFLLLLARQFCAQTKENPWTVGLFGIKTEYIGDLGNEVFKFGNSFHSGGALSFDRYISRFFDAGIYGATGNIFMDNGIGTYTDFDGWLNRSEHDNEVQNFKVARLTNVNLHTRFKIWGNERARVVPYIGLAAGMAFYNNIQTNYIDANGDRQFMRYQQYDDGWHDVNTANTITLGGIVGLECRLSPIFSIRYQAVGSWTSRDDLDFYAKGGNDLQLQHNVGLTINFSCRKKDADGDGVPDYLDKCPKLFGVPENSGCPLEEGIVDVIDNDETDTFVDTDGDSVPDCKDDCPDTPADVRVDENGCPVDTDGDGVPDYKDNCPDTPTGVRVDENGCPVDTDGDGVPDYLDNCPDEAGLPENGGCRFEAVLFEFGKAEIKIPEAIGLLDSIIAVLVQQPAYTIIVLGHTDDAGSDTYNQKLSKKRAEAVQQYMEKKGISSSRITVDGYGATQPIDDNSTEQGSAQNRRVEFVIQ